MSLALTLLAVVSLSGASTGCSNDLTAPRLAPIAFDEGAPATPVAFRWSDPAEPYLATFRTRHALGDVVAGATTDLERVQRMSRWVHAKWSHDGSNVARPGDPMAILAAAAAGQRFRCIEYAVVLAGALDALGIPARVLGLNTQDVETRASGARHVVAEAWLRDEARWVMVDAQWDAMPTVAGKPASAVAVQRALSDGAPVGVLSRSGMTAGAYARWVAPYLYYFDLPLDQRVVGVANQPGYIMLVPLGAKNPTVFERTQRLTGFTYTHSRAAFYAAPGGL